MFEDLGETLVGTLRSRNRPHEGHGLERKYDGGEGGGVVIEAALVV